MAKRRTKEEMAAARAFRRQFSLRSLAALRERRFSDAIQASVEFEKQQPVARGIGIDWHNYDASPDVHRWQIMFESCPKVLSQVDPSVLDDLRILAAMWSIWGPDDFDAYVPAGLKEKLGEDPIWKAREFDTYGRFKSELESWRLIGVKQIGYQNCNDEIVCRACRKLCKTTFNIDDAPEMPFDGCKSETGCRCWAHAVFE